MKFINYLAVICLLLLVLTACSNIKGSDAIPSETINGEKKADKQAIYEKSSDKSDLREAVADDFSYDLSKPLISSKDVINYQKLGLPSKINDLKMSVSFIFDRQRLLVLLYEDTPLSISREIGFYNFVTDEYETLFTIQKDGEGEHSISICDADGTNIVYKDTVFEDINDLLGSDTLCVFNTKTKGIIKIREYSRVRSGSGASYVNGAVLHNGMVYYDEAEETDGVTSKINLYKFDLQNNSTGLVKERAQNPTIYKGELFYSIEDDISSGFYFQSIDEKTKIKIDKDINSLTSTGDELYTFSNEELDRRNGVSIRSIEKLASGEELLTIMGSISWLVGENGILAWRNDTLEKPVIYLEASDEFVIFDELEKGYNSYKFSDDFGILFQSNDYGARRYYVFMLNE